MCEFTITLLYMAPEHKLWPNTGCTELMQRKEQYNKARNNWFLMIFKLMLAKLQSIQEIANKDGHKRETLLRVKTEGQSPAGVKIA